VPPHAIWRRLRHPFSISAPRMAVRTQLGWPWRAGILAVVVTIVVGMWWWGFDFGQIFSGFDRSEMKDRVAALETENAKLGGEAAAARSRFAELESDVAINRGAQSSLTHQNAQLAQENSQLKEELAFLQKLVSDSSKQGAMTVQRLTVEPEAPERWRYGVLLVRGGNPRDEFAGHASLAASVVVPGNDGTAPHAVVVNLPADQPGAAAPLTLKFKYYQRVEGTIRVPEGAHLTALTVRIFEDGVAVPRATRSLTNP
jgi:cytoskeletal protein RodZ